MLFQDTIATALFDVAIDALIGEWQVSVISDKGVSNTVVFSVSDNEPFISSITPDFALAGETITVTLKGTNFREEMTIKVSEAGIVVSDIHFVSVREATAVFNIAEDASPVERNISVATENGNSNSVNFSISGTAPAINRINPDSGKIGEKVKVRLTGENFTSSITITISEDTGITISSVNVESANVLTAVFNIANDSSPGVAGVRQVSVTTIKGTSNSVVFTVILPRSCFSSSLLSGQLTLDEHLTFPENVEPSHAQNTQIGILESLRNFRDVVLSKSLKGIKLIRYYYKYSDEVTEIVNANPGLKSKAMEIQNELLEIFKGSREDETIEYILNNSIPVWLESEINILIDDISEKGSDDLKNAIKEAMKLMYE